MLVEKVRRTIEEHKLIDKNQHIVIGLSGGPDSVCLFHTLLRLKNEYNLTIHAVHVNHKFRPGAAERDQHYVENICNEKGIPCHTFVVDCNKLAAEAGMTSEEAGRKARYDAFRRVAESLAIDIAENQQDKTELGEESTDSDETCQLRIDDAKNEPAPQSAIQSKFDSRLAQARNQVKIAVAQNANDQAETILFRLLRGTGTDGLAGIAYERQEGGFSVIRPILDIYRSEIEEYYRTNKLNPVIDHTNNESIYARNKIRLELLPYLEENYNENMKESLVRLGRIAAADKDYIWQQVETEYRRLVQYSYNATPQDSKHTSSQPGEISSSQHARTQSQQITQKTQTQPQPTAIRMDRAELSRIHPTIRHRIILKAFGEIGLEKDISEERIKAADFIIDKKQAPKTVQFPRGYRLTVAKGIVTLYNGEISVK